MDLDCKRNSWELYRILETTSSNWRINIHDKLTYDVYLIASSGRSYRKEITLLELGNMFPNEESACKWFEGIHWPDSELFCLRCGSENMYRCKH